MLCGVRTRALCFSAFVLVSIAPFGCASGDDDTGSTSNAALGDATTGKTVADKYLCVSCHGADLAGSTAMYPGTTAYAANLTPDMETGLGEWSSDLIKTAILTGIDDDGEQLCSPPMPKFQDMNMTDAEAMDLVAYLQSIPAVQREVPESECAGKSGDDEGDEGAAGFGAP